MTRLKSLVVGAITAVFCAVILVAMFEPGKVIPASAADAAQEAVTGTVTAALTGGAS